MNSRKEQYVAGIRSVHKTLRRQYRAEKDFDKVWEEHCRNDERLKEYAKSMLDLATEIWDEDCDGKNRIVWCVDVCREYFQNGGLQNIVTKDDRRRAHFVKNPDDFHCGPNPHCHTDLNATDLCQRKSGYDASMKIRLLDVGSCYNPFSKYEEFEVTAIDLKPACKTVYQIDFLKAAVKHGIDIDEAVLSHSEKSTGSRNLSALPADYFHVVVFSLLLTYIPSAHVRWKMCEKAHEVLDSNGILLIITPDSNHQNKNAALMKRWKLAIESIGFQRFKYSKDTHLHFMAFRKVPEDYLWDRKQSEQWSNEIACKLNIPQDFQESSDEESNSHWDCETHRDELVTDMCELPCYDSS